MEKNIEKDVADDEMNTCSENNVNEEGEKCKSENGETAEENGGDLSNTPGHKPADIPRQVMVRNLDKKATSDDLEDFFYDNYENLEEIHRSTFFRGKGEYRKEIFKGSVILTFTDEESAKKFLDLDTIKYNGYTLNKISMEEFNERKEQNQKKRAEEKEKKKAETGSRDDCTVVCSGFHRAASSLQEVMNYMYDNHENIIDVNMEVIRDKRGFQRWDSKTTVTFGDKRAADRFLGLTYVKFKGNYVTRSNLSEYRENQRKSEETDVAAKRKMAEKRVGEFFIQGASVRLTGFNDEETAREEIKKKLVKELSVEENNIAYITFMKGDKEATVRLKTPGAEDLAKLWNEKKVTINGDEISAEVLSGEKEDSYLNKCKEDMVNRMERKRPRRFVSSTYNNKSTKSNNWLEDY